ncbi:cobaltochelatase domain protein [Clostridium argentinense CDC 2741]|uniref:Cobaltochelatase domain protein n=1 Tax=Clostridium argentinense CDC 2741 TaxID=1418104 RepID=A0A0C1UC96_9CLOT|nr:hypothetical protein [Clostridium argentinense]ARC83955.1 hypothetical protein RSJ17_05145 [Clostridium argentinense]KIE45165.1 cobaltochelatase domain protein [Clostridium argentinense CDC 2741]NFF39441.1 hypothetical protein [Clostridium argentinense]NFP50354.1 hypothetical protein [Clostridium argentinense]NFP74226.1 hypothetical protein [Clostridium argentinense]
MFRLIFIMSGFDSTYKLKESNIFIKKHYKESIGIDFIDSYKMDNSIEEYKICREKIEKSDMVFISMHGGVTHFKSLEKRETPSGDLMVLEDKISVPGIINEIYLLVFNLVEEYMKILKKLIMIKN